jgi:hypothetical protein
LARASKECAQKSTAAKTVPTVATTMPTVHLLVLVSSSVNAKEVSRVQAMTDIAIQSTTAWMATEGAARPMPFV